MALVNFPDTVMRMIRVNFLSAIMMTYLFIGIGVIRRLLV